MPKYHLQLRAVIFATVNVVESPDDPEADLERIAIDLACSAVSLFPPSDSAIVLYLDTVCTEEIEEV